MVEHQAALRNVPNAVGHITPLPPLPTFETPEKIPPAYDLKTIFLGGIFILALLTALYVAQSIIMPIVLAFVLKLVLQPLLRYLQKLHLPQMLASIVIMFLLVSMVAGLAMALSGPFTVWAEKIPNGIPKLQERLGFLNAPLHEAQQLMVHAENLTASVGPKVMPVAVEGTRWTDKLFIRTGAFAGSLFTTSLMLFFLLVSGDTFLRRLVEILPRFKDKRQAVDISQQIEADVSRYLLTITMMNAILGVATGLIVALTGLGDPALWGTLAFLFNYIPVIGPALNVSVLLLAGLMADIDGRALLPAALYLATQIMLGTFVTPLLLAKRFTLNPVLVILSLVFWYWMWGVPGAILSMPMLAITKIICDRIQPLMSFGHFLEG